MSLYNKKEKEMTINWSKTMPVTGLASLYGLVDVYFINQYKYLQYDITCQDKPNLTRICERVNLTGAYNRCYMYNNVYHSEPDTINDRMQDLYNRYAFDKRFVAWQLAEKNTVLQAGDIYAFAELYAEYKGMPIWKLLRVPAPILNIPRDFLSEEIRKEQEEANEIKDKIYKELEYAEGEKYSDYLSLGYEPCGHLQMDTNNRDVYDLCYDIYGNINIDKLFIQNGTVKRLQVACITRHSDAFDKMELLFDSDSLSIRYLDHAYSVIHLKKQSEKLPTCYNFYGMQQSVEDITSRWRQDVLLDQIEDDVIDVDLYIEE